MPFCFVAVKDFPDFTSQNWIDRWQPLGHILMYGAFADMEHLCGVTNRSIVINDVLCFADNPFLQICQI